MAAKRSATTELNHDNWNEKNVPEEAGTFAKAAEDVLEKRVIRAAKRRLASGDGPVKNAFSSFTGFKATPTKGTSPFCMLVNSKLGSSEGGTVKSSENGTDSTKEDTAKVPDSLSATGTNCNKSSQGDDKIFKKSSDYFARLKGLNESVAQWIKTHVDSNPFCILTPIFRDYERYLKEIESERNKTETERKDKESSASKEETKTSATENKSEKLFFGDITTNKPSTTTESTATEKLFFGDITANKPEPSKSVFGGSSRSTDAPRSIFDTEGRTEVKNIFGNTSSEKNPFLSKPSSIISETKIEKSESKPDKIPSDIFPSISLSSGTFSFGQTTTSNGASAGFSFGSAKPFSFGAQAVKPRETDEKTETDGKSDDEEEPPKPEFKPVTEEGAVYEQRCRVYVKKDGSFGDRGIGTLFLKPTPNGKTQLIVRAETSLGNLLINTLLTESTPIKRMNKNVVMVLCLPLPDSQPPPVPVLLKVKTEEIADTLLETLNKHKK